MVRSLKVHGLQVIIIPGSCDFGATPTGQEGSARVNVLCFRPIKA